MKIFAYGLSLILILFATHTFANPPDQKPNRPGKATNEKQHERKDGHDAQDDFGLALSLISASDARSLARGAGTTGYKPLPPGIQKNLARGKPMPPGIQKTRMPDGFLNQLPRHAGYEWRNAGTDLLLVQVGTEIIADVLMNVFE